MRGIAKASMMHTISATVLAGVVVLLAACGVDAPQSLPSPPKIDRTRQQHFGILPQARVSQSAHYKVYSTATPAQTAQVSSAAEALYRSYVECFGPEETGKTFELVLYKNQTQFRAYNRSSPWAEAYYLAPRSYAYFSRSGNPHHWMLHEATHQLMRELSDYKPAKWANEGVASYFGSSVLDATGLRRGDPDPSAYPIWWLSSLKLSGNLDQDIASGKIIPLRQLITDNGPDINLNVNLYYMHYWSLSHFLFHYRDGRYAAKFRQAIALGASLEDFETLIGPVDEVQTQWYDHFMREIARVRASGRRN